MTSPIPFTRVVFIVRILSFLTDDLATSCQLRLVHPAWQDSIENYGAELWQNIVASLIRLCTDSSSSSTTTAASAGDNNNQTQKKSLATIGGASSRHRQHLNNILLRLCARHMSVRGPSATLWIMRRCGSVPGANAIVGADGFTPLHAALGGLASSPDQNTMLLSEKQADFLKFLLESSSCSSSPVASARTMSSSRQAPPTSSSWCDVNRLSVPPNDAAGSRSASNNRRRRRNMPNRRADREAYKPRNITPLQVAINSVSVGAVRFLCCSSSSSSAAAVALKELDVTVQDDLGNNALHTACGTWFAEHQRIGKYDVSSRVAKEQKKNNNIKKLDLLGFALNPDCFSPPRSLTHEEFPKLRLAIIEAILDFVFATDERHHSFSPHHGSALLCVVATRNCLELTPFQMLCSEQDENLTDNVAVAKAFLQRMTLSDLMLRSPRNSKSTNNNNSSSSRTHAAASRRGTRNTAAAAEPASSGEVHDNDDDDDDGGDNIVPAPTGSFGLVSCLQHRHNYKIAALILDKVRSEITAAQKGAPSSDLRALMASCKVEMKQALGELLRDDDTPEACSLLDNLISVWKILAAPTTPAGKQPRAGERQAQQQQQQQQQQQPEFALENVTLQHTERRMLGCCGYRHATTVVDQTLLAVAIAHANEDEQQQQQQPQQRQPQAAATKNNNNDDGGDDDDNNNKNTNASTRENVPRRSFVTVLLDAGVVDPLGSCHSAQQALAWVGASFMESPIQLALRFSKFGIARLLLTRYNVPKDVLVRVPEQEYVRCGHRMYLGTSSRNKDLPQLFSTLLIRAMPWLPDEEPDPYEEHGMMKTSRFLICEMHCSVNFADPDGYTPLMRAIEHQDVELVKLVLLNDGTQTCDDLKEEQLVQRRSHSIKHQQGQQQEQVDSSTDHHQPVYPSWMCNVVELHCRRKNSGPAWHMLLTMLYNEYRRINGKEQQPPRPLTPPEELEALAAFQQKFGERSSTQSNTNGETTQTPSSSTAAKSKPRRPRHRRGRGGGGGGGGGGPAASS